MPFYLFQMSTSRTGNDTRLIHIYHTLLNVLTIHTHYYLSYTFPCSADHERGWPPCKVFFFGLAYTLNVRNNNGDECKVQYNGRLLPDIILLTQCYYNRGTRLNAMKRFCLCSL